MTDLACDNEKVCVSKISNRDLTDSSITELPPHDNVDGNNTDTGNSLLDNDFEKEPEFLSNNNDQTNNKEFTTGQ